MGCASSREDGAAGGGSGSGQAEPAPGAQPLDPKASATPPTAFTDCKKGGLVVHDHSDTSCSDGMVTVWDPCDAPATHAHSSNSDTGVPSGAPRWPGNAAANRHAALLLPGGSSGSGDPLASRTHGHAPGAGALSAGPLVPLNVARTLPQGSIKGTRHPTTGGGVGAEVDVDDPYMRASHTHHQAVQAHRLAAGQPGSSSIMCRASSAATQLLIINTTGTVEGPSFVSLGPPSHAHVDASSQSSSRPRVEGVVHAAQQHLCGGMAAAAADLVLEMQEKEEEDAMHEAFDMLQWKRYYLWNRDKPRALLKHLWQRYDKSQWTFYCLSYIQQDALEATYQGDNIIHGLACRIEELLSSGSPSLTASDAASSSMPHPVALQRLPWQQQPTQQQQSAKGGVPSSPSLASGSMSSSGASATMAGDRLFGLMHTLVSRGPGGGGSPCKVVGVLLAQGTAHIPQCLAELYELGSEWQVWPADVTDLQVKGFVSSLIASLPPSPDYTVVSTREIL